MKPFTQLLIAAGLSLFAASIFATTDKPSNYLLDVEFTPHSSHMQGQATMQFNEPLTEGRKTFWLHGELDVDSITLNSKPVEFETRKVFYDMDYALVADEVSFDVDADTPHAELVVTYQGHFHPSSARSPSDYMRIDDDGVFLRAWGYSPWFPVFLGPDEDVYQAAFPNVRFKVPRQYQLVFIGEKISEQLTPEHAITTWRAGDVGLSDLQVTAQKFLQLKSGNVTIYHLDNDESRLAAKSVANFTEQLLAYYSHHYRQNPGLGNLNLLEMPKYGDISSHNMVGISSETFRSFDTAAYAKRTIAHELVHPFVSVQVSRADPLWSLAIEGFPSYFHLPAMRHLYGQAVYDDFLTRMENYYLENKGAAKDRWGNDRPPEIPLLKITADSMSDYKDDYILSGRTRLFFNYLLRQMGDEPFAAFARDLFGRTQLTEEEFVVLCGKHLPGQQAQIHTWLYSNEFPEEFRISP